MTINTALRGIPKFFPGRVATATFYGTMLTLEFEVRHFMVECFQIQLNDIGFSSLVICMAVFAFAVFYLGISTMKSFVLFEIDSHRLVALQAFLVLTAFFEQGVALGAF